jgi:hypothetical protein
VRRWLTPTCRRRASSAVLTPDWDELVAVRDRRKSLTGQRVRLLNEAEAVLTSLPPTVRACYR